VPGALLVFTAQRAVATWARTVGTMDGPLGTGLGVRPVVVQLTGDVAEALLDHAHPELAFFVAWNIHDRYGPEAQAIVERATDLVEPLADEALRRPRPRPLLDSPTPPAPPEVATAARLRPSRAAPSTAPRLPLIACELRNPLQRARHLHPDARALRGLAPLRLAVCVAQGLGPVLEGGAVLLGTRSVHAGGGADSVREDVYVPLLWWRGRCPGGVTQREQPLGRDGRAERRGPSDHGGDARRWRSCGRRRSYRLRGWCRGSPHRCPGGTGAASAITPAAPCTEPPTTARSQPSRPRRRTPRRRGGGEHPGSSPLRGACWSGRRGPPRAASSLAALLLARSVEIERPQLQNHEFLMSRPYPSTIFANTDRQTRPAYQGCLRRATCLTSETSYEHTSSAVNVH
jgi:hypothetical protein